MISIFKNGEDCCGCGACVNACPVSAISMQEDELGFKYPAIDSDKCIKCGLCEKTCVYKKDTLSNNTPQKVYAVTNKNRDTVMRSTSGGVFAEIARKVLEDGGLVYGVAYGDDISTDGVRHVCIENESELARIQGSKYVHSNMGFTMQKIKSDLESGRTVMFSGSPCQIAGLRGYLKKDYDNLILVDVICHGVPSQRWFSEFITSIEKKIKGHITDFKFRDKSRGQGMNGGVYYTDKNGRNKYFCKKGWLFSYFYLFSYGAILRENCYACPYSKAERYSDITIGDYWKYKEVFPDGKRPVEMNSINGVSCALLNTQKGIELFNKIDDNFYMLESSLDDIVARNQQLRAPADKHPLRDAFTEAYKKDRYEGVDRLYKKKFKKVIIKSFIANYIPKPVARMLQK